MTWSVGNRSAWATALVVGLVVILLGALGPSTAPARAAARPVDATAAAAASGGLFTSLPPTRLLDTRSGVGAPVAEVGPGATLHLQVGGRGGVPSSGVAAVVLNVTVTGASGHGHVTVFGDGTALPTASNLNFRAGQTVPNLVVTPVSSNGKVALYNGSAGSTHLIADVEGYYRSGAPGEPGAFQSLTPARVLDTRSGVGAALTKVGPSGTVHLQVGGEGGVPASGVSAVVLNVTVVEPARGGHLTVHADGSARPVTSNLNFEPGQTIANLVVAQVGTNGEVALDNGSSGALDLVADVAGYVLAGTPAQPGAFRSLAPLRLLDTRSGVGAAQAVVARGATVHLQVGGRGGVPTTGVAAVVLNVTVVGPTGSGYITAHADGTARPTASNLNFVRAQTVPNLVVVPVAPDGRVALYNGSTGSTHLLADVAGYYIAPASTRSLPPLGKVTFADHVAQWNVLCSDDHTAADDPIVFPGQFGASHMHTFFGNTSTNAASTLASLRATTSSCGRNMGTSDPSAYWVPSLMKQNADGTSSIVGSEQLSQIYYRRAGGGRGPGVYPFPPGLRMIAGSAKATSDQPASIVSWSCGRGGPESPHMFRCAGGSSAPMVVSLAFPSCWDGVHLDSADHKSHMAYAASNGACPASHPVSLPELNIEVEYVNLGGGPEYFLASGGIYSFHGDFFNAWDNRVQNALVATCLNGARECADINRSGNTLFRPSYDPEPITIDLNNFSSTSPWDGRALQEPTPSPSPPMTMSTMGH